MELKNTTPVEFGNTTLDIVMRETLSEDNQMSTQQWYKRLNLPKEFTKGRSEKEVNNELLYNLKCENLKMYKLILDEEKSHSEFLNFEFKAMKEGTK